MEKERSKAKLKASRVQGAMGEAIVRGDLIAEGKAPKRTPFGQDFTTNDGVKHEVKTGKAKLSRLQNATKKENPRKYKIHRVNVNMNIDY